MGKKTPKITDGGVAKVKPAVTKPQNSAASSIPPSTSKVGKKKDNQRIDETPEMAIASSSIAPKKAKASAEIDGLFGQLKNNTTKKQTPKVSVFFPLFLRHTYSDSLHFFVIVE